MRITGTFLLADDGPRAGISVQFIPENTPFADGLGIITSPTIEVTLGENGVMPETTLEQGNYLVRIGLHKRDYGRIGVLDNDDTVDISTLWVAEPIVIADVLQVGVNFRVKNGVFQLKNKETGLYHRIDMVGIDPATQIETQPGEA